nr:MAG TPA: hypothetical protein [Caudoviricetes sp.]
MVRINNLRNETISPASAGLFFIRNKPNALHTRTL